MRLLSYSAANSNPAGTLARLELCLPSLLCLVCLLLAACTSPRLERNMRDKPFGLAYKPDNVYAVDRLPPGFERVLLLPPADPRGGELAGELTDAMLASLRQVARFEVVRSGRAYGAVSPSVSPSASPSVSPSASHSGSQPVPLAELPLPAAVLDEAARRGADGILQLQFTHYRPYKPLQIGLRARLVALGGEGRVLWEIDELFDAGHKPVAVGARQYAESRIEQAFPLQSSYSVLMSPARFAGYVGLTAFESLPAPAKP